ncbi:unnamed protein product [Prunus armeniaca]
MVLLVTLYSQSWLILYLLVLLSELLRTVRGNSSVDDFLDHVNTIADNLALSSSLVRETAISYGDLEALLLSVERRISSHFAHVSNSSSTTLANVLGSSQAAYASSYHDGSSSGYVWVQCQICGRLGHSTIICYNRLNLAYEGHVPPQLLNTMAAHNTSSSAA